MRQRTPWHRHVIAAAMMLLGASGCPVLADDDFASRPASGGASFEVDGGAGTTAAGGSSGEASMGGAGNASGGSAGGTGGGGTTGDPCSSCESAGCCDGRCVDLDTDRDHCGKCGSMCRGTICSNGSCTNECAAGYLNCDQNVVNGCEVAAATDADHCGSCGIRCPLGATCQEGTCQCAPGTANCDNAPENGCEIDLNTNAANCGACGTTCGANQVCTGGGCACAAGYADCNREASDGCEVDLLTDREHCGQCAVACGPNTECNAGQCECLSGFLDCSSAAGCESSASSADTCGQCTTQCGAGAPLCTGAGCAPGCAVGEQRCDDTSCVDLMTNPLHCGDCGIAVGPNQVCIGGTPTCSSQDFADCTAAPGCETDLRTDASHCGACNNACKPGSSCGSKQCACAPGTPNDCGDQCRQCCASSQCSDGNPCTADTCDVNGTCSSAASCTSDLCCGGQGCYECCSDAQCPGGQVCSGNRCVLQNCAGTEVLCAGACVDLKTDPNHCNGCGNHCGSGRACSNGVCTPKWVPTAAPPAGFAARSRAATTAMGSRLFVWGGLGASAVELDNGAIYDPATDGWTTINSADAPTARLLATAVWTGSVVVVWGGGGGGSVSYASGGVYDPALDRWTPMRTAGAPSARRAAHGIWTGSRVLFWGGFDAQGAAVDSAAYLYDPVNDTWSSVNEGEPTARTGSATGFSGLEWLVYGGATGSTSTTETFRFAPLTGDWTARAAGPSKRRDAFSTWDGAALFVWGGQTAGSAQTLLADGSRYLPGSDAWSGVPAVGAPSARAASHRETGWAAAIATGRTLIVGGYSGKLPLSSAEIQRDGAIYDAASGTWLAVPAWPSGEARLWAAAGWTGTEFVLSGGLNGSAPSNTGERIRP